MNDAFAVVDLCTSGVAAFHWDFTRSIVEGLLASLAKENQQLN